MLRFIWFFTVCQSTRLGVSSIQRVNNTGCIIVCVANVTSRSKSYIEEFKATPNNFLDSHQNSEICGGWEVHNIFPIALKNRTVLKETFNMVTLNLNCQKEQLINI